MKTPAVTIVGTSVEPIAAKDVEPVRWLAMVPMYSCGFSMAPVAVALNAELAKGKKLNLLSQLILQKQTCRKSDVSL